MLFSNVFWSDVWQDDFSWKQIDMDYLGNTDKQTKGTLARSLDQVLALKILPQDLYMVIQFPNNEEICSVRNFK